MASFYKTFLPKVPQKRGKMPSSYCIGVYERGIKDFESTDDLAAASQYKMELQKLKTTSK